MKNNQSKQCVSLTLEDAKKLYNSDNENFKTIALSAFSKQELEKKELPKSWEDLEDTFFDGYWIDNDSEILEYDNYEISKSNYNKNVFATEKQAKSALAYAQLTQLMKVYNDNEKLDWEDNTTSKFCIVRVQNIIKKSECVVSYNPIVFKSKELRDKFFNNFQDLLKEYFMID